MTHYDDGAPAPLSIRERMAAHGFVLTQTGGGCSAYVRDDGQIEETVTLADWPHAPTSMYDLVDIGTRNRDGIDTEALGQNGYTLADVLRALDNPSQEYVLLTLRLHNGLGGEQTNAERR